MLTEEDVINANENTMARLADRLKPHLLAGPTHAGPDIKVTVARMNKNQAGGNALAWVDLTFHACGIELHTVEGFKLMQKADGTRWLSVPREGKEKTDPDTGEVKTEYKDKFKFGSKAQADLARHAVIDAYEPKEHRVAGDIPFGEDAYKGSSVA